MGVFTLFDFKMLKMLILFHPPRWMRNYYTITTGFGGSQMPKYEKQSVEAEEQSVEIVPGSPEDYQLIRYSSVLDETPRWLMYPYIPFGMITVVHGYPGSSKSSMLLDLVARATRGEVLPDGSRLPGPIAAVYQCT